MHMRAGLALSLLTLMAATGAVGFGTISLMGQNAEHERITRHALTCGLGASADICFQSKSVDELAGKSGAFGAVGAPDNPVRGLLTSSFSHCDNGDSVATKDYPQNQAAAQNMLVGCRSVMMAHLNEAVNDAGALLYSDSGLFHNKGEVNGSEIPSYISCTYMGTKGRAKCNVLEDLGLLLHASEDFYSHSNWVDKADAGPITLSNPAGLGNNFIAPWLDLRVGAPAFPAGLITGCFDDLSLASPSKGCSGHVKHEDLNKDKGTIDPSIGVGTTNRGKIGDNFARAVNIAELDARDKIRTFKEKLEAKYGKAAGDRMFCAVTNDDPTSNCK